jgi:Zn-dependent metalloprotease
MTRLTKVSAVLFTGAAIWGCSSAPTYNGEAKLQSINFIPKATVKVTSDVEKSVTKFVNDTDELTDYDDNWKVTATTKGPFSSHVRMSQTHDGVKVWGADVVVHTQGDQVARVAGTRVSSLGGFDTRASIDDASALVTAKSDYGKLVTQPRTDIKYKQESAELVILPMKGSDARLAYHVVLNVDPQGGAGPGRWNYFIDAKTGSILSQFNAVDTVFAQGSGPGGNEKVSRQWTSQLDVKKDGANFIMDTPRLQTLDMQQQESGGVIASSADLNNFPDAPVNDAHGASEFQLDMLTGFGFNSIDNNGFKLISRVHFGVKFENAFWDGTQMTYGDGDTTFFPLSGDLDVGAHEISHGFTEFHSNLIYDNESGGMNESFSDINGALISFHLNGDAGEFDIGRDIFKGDEALRFMCNPPQDGISIDDFNNYDDSLDVHFSSGIMNKAFCQAAQQLGGGTATQASTFRAGAAWYHANDAFWTQSSTFKEGCQGVLDAARDLGFSNDELDILRTAWSDRNVFCDGLVEPLVCDETITADHGEISSPNFPADYPENVKHTTCIIPASGNAATLHFTDFNIENGFDFLTIKDGEGNVISTSTGTTAPADFTGSTIVVKFTSDFIIGAPGWRATW